MNRRRFLQMLSASAFGAMTLDVEKLLWVPGQKTIFLPPVTPSFMFDKESGLSIRIVQEFSTDAIYQGRFDILYGWGSPKEIGYGLG